MHGMFQQKGVFRFSVFQHEIRTEKLYGVIKAHNKGNSGSEGDKRIHVRRLVP